MPIHARIISCPQKIEAGPEICYEGFTLPTVTGEGLAATLFSTTFEEASSALAQVPRADVEPDGFFIVSGEEQGKRWQLEGGLYDRLAHLSYVDIRGYAPSELLDQFLTCLGWPETQVLFELVSHSVYVDEPTFRHLLTQLCG